MSKNDQPFKPISLAQHFESPDNFRGSFGWICGYSADAGFLNDAAFRFTRQTDAQRKYNGSISLAMILDPGNPNLTLIDAPGIAHLPIRNFNDKPFLLQHAKVAILGFQHESDSHRWQLRLIVSTGNWTRGTLEDSLDLVWRIDLDSEELENRDDASSKACADIKAAWGFMSWLRVYFDDRILYALPPERTYSESGNANILLKSWIEQAEKNTEQINSRFLDNRKQSLLSQLPSMVKATGIIVKRNYLAMGSGFYEASHTKDAIPSVLRNIIEVLKDQQLLTVKPRLDIFVNPIACQSVATSLKALKASNFVVRPAGQPSYFGKNTQRSLHAKFIFSANFRNHSNNLNNSWLYLGSGNLTGPGFSNKASANVGNLEAGVIFAPGEVYLKQTKGLNQAKVITNVLPVQRDIDVSNLNLQSGESDMPERDAKFIAAPIAWLLWCDDSNSRWLKAPDYATAPFEVLNETGDVCEHNANGRYLWSGNRPLQVQIRWNVDGNVQRSYLPILDEFGRLASIELPKIDLDEAWWQLANFPMPPDDLDEELMVASFHNHVAPTLNLPNPVASYPIRKMMQLIENIAFKQTAISQADWPLWCVQLEQSLTQASESIVVEKFAELKVNPLGPLWEAPFRPIFAEKNDTTEGLLYESVLHRVEAEWNVASLRKIGAHDDTRI